MSLTRQQRLYAEARFAGHSKKDAALAAGCPERTASQAGSRLERHPNVVAHLVRLKAIESESVPGAGADPVPPGVNPSAAVYDDPIDLLKAEMNNPRLDPKVRIQAASALLPYVHQKMGESGKKDKADDAARDAASGRFQPQPAPQLTLLRSTNSRN